MWLAFKSFYPDQRLDQVITHLRNQPSSINQYHHLLITGDPAYFGAHSVYQLILDKTYDLAGQGH